MNLVVILVVAGSGACSLQEVDRLKDACIERGVSGHVKFHNGHYVAVLEGGDAEQQIFKTLFVETVGSGDFVELLNAPGRQVGAVDFKVSRLKLYDPKWLNVEALECFIRLYKATIQRPQLEHFIKMLDLVFASEYVEDYLYPPKVLSETYTRNTSRAAEA